MQLADDAGLRRAPSCRDGKVVLGRLELRLRWSARRPPRRSPSRARSRPSTIAGDVARSSRQVAAAREIDVRDLEQARSRCCRRRRCGARPSTSEGSSVVRRAAAPRDRLRQPRASGSQSSGTSDGVYASVSPAPASTSSTSRWSALLAREPAGHLAAQRQRLGHLVELEARDLLDHVDLARDVAGAPGRDDDLAVPRGRSRVARAARTALRPGVEAETASSRSGRKRTTGRSGSCRARRRRRPSARRRARRSARSRARPPARRGTGRRPSPSGSSLRCAASGARRCAREPAARSWPPRAAPSVVASVISVSSPPMIPAIATARSASAISRSLGSSLRSTPSSVRMRLARRRARRTTMRRLGERRRSRTRAAGCRARA